MADSVKDQEEAKSKEGEAPATPTTDTATPETDNQAATTEPTPAPAPVAETTEPTSVHDPLTPASSAPDPQFHKTHISAYEADIEEKLVVAQNALNDVREAVNNYKAAVANNLVTTAS